MVLTRVSLVSLSDRDDYINLDNRNVREDREDLNDDAITINSRTKTAEALTVLAVEDTNQTELLN